MNEHLDAVPAAIVGPTDRVENSARRRWSTPRVIEQTIGDDTEGGINPTNIEPTPPFNAVTS